MRYFFKVLQTDFNFSILSIPCGIPVCYWSFVHAHSLNLVQNCLALVKHCSGYILVTSILDFQANISQNFYDATKQFCKKSIIFEKAYCHTGLSLQSTSVTTRVEKCCKKG